MSGRRAAVLAVALALASATAQAQTTAAAPPVPTAAYLAHKHRVLEQLAGYEGDLRRGGAAALLVGGGAYVVLGAAALSDPLFGPLGYAVTPMGAAMVGGGFYRLLAESDAERALRVFVDGLTVDNPDVAKTLANTDALVREILRRDQKLRFTARALGGVAVGLGVLMVVLGELSNEPALRFSTRFTGITTAFLGGAGIYASFQETASERFAHLWFDEPREAPPTSRFEVTPLPGGVAFAWSGRF